MDNNINYLGTSKEIIPAAAAPAQISEQPVNKLFFSAREWTFNKACKDNVGSRSFMEGPDGIIAEAYMIGNWNWNWTEIVSRQLILPKNMLHTFTFWLNGGENDRNNEVCRFEIVYNNDHENRYTYNLNRNFVKPLKRVNGWELYEIPFITGDNEYTELRFVAQYAPMTVLTAKDRSAYANLEDTADEFEGERPQRHNIIFDDGWPNNTWYSTKALRKSHMAAETKTENKTSVPPTPPVPPVPPHINANTGEGSISDKLEEVNSALSGVSGTLGGVPAMVSGLMSGLLTEIFQTELRDKVTAAIKLCGTNNDQIIDTVMESLEDRLDALTDQIADNVEAMTDQIEGMLDAVENSLDAVQNAVEDLET